MDFKRRPGVVDAGSAIEGHPFLEWGFEVVGSSDEKCQYSGMTRLQGRPPNELRHVIYNHRSSAYDNYAFGETFIPRASQPR